MENSPHSLSTAPIVAANDLLRFARRIFASGVRRRAVPNNPIADFSPRLDAGGPLCVRKGELLGGRWEEIDREGGIKSGPVWHLPAARTKTAEGADIPLVPQVVEWFKALKVEER
jgi:hypothetical protein